MRTTESINESLTRPLRRQVERSATAIALPIVQRFRGFDQGGLCRHLILVGHPWSGVGLLSLVLAANPDVWPTRTPLGRESQITDLAAAERTAGLRVALRGSQQSTRPWVLSTSVTRDVPSEVLCDERSKVVLMLRRPEETLPRLGKGPRGAKQDGAAQESAPSETALLRQYQRSLDQLRHVASTVADPDRMFVISFDDLTRRTTATLDGLSRYLDLPENLSARFEPPSRGSSSRSDKLLLGRIITSDYGPTPPLQETLSRAADSMYRQTLDELRAARRGWLPTSPGSTSAGT